METSPSEQDFFAAVAEDLRPFVQETAQSLTQAGYRVKIEDKASGYFMSFAHPKTKKSLLNLFFRKDGLHARVYADHCGDYADYVKALPQTIESSVRKNPNCKRLINPEDCNPKCPTGYDFYIGENRYRKCRYQGFQFPLNSETKPYVGELVRMESEQRAG